LEKLGHTIKGYVEEYLKLDGRVQNGLIWLRVGISGGIL
jgi:hypothetical protein